jgi:hypothetical protein
MIAREEMQMLVAGAANEAARGIEGVTGRRMTRSELDAICEVFSTFGRLVADRCYSSSKMPPPPPYRERRPAQFFNPLQTQELRAVSDEDIAKAKQK